MADSSGIGHVSQSVQDALKAAIFASGPFAGTQVDLRSPKEIGTPAAGTMILSFWLYRVTRFDELENLPPRLRADGRLARAPLPLTLHYLVTPLASDELGRHRLLGAAMQALHDQARLGEEFVRAGLTGESDGPIGLHLEQQSFEDTSRIWHALHEPYQLSVSYLAQYVTLESARSYPTGAPVIETDTRFAAIEAVA
jgi:hypothetical protein